MPRFLKETGQFKTDKKRIKGSGRYDWEKMRSTVKELMSDRLLRPDLIPAREPKLSEVEYGVASRSNSGGAIA